METKWKESHEGIAAAIMLAVLFIVGSILWTHNENAYDREQEQCMLYKYIRDWREERDLQLVTYRYIGDTQTKCYYSIAWPEVLEIPMARLIGFDDDTAAEEAGYAYDDLGRVED